MHKHLQAIVYTYVYLPVAHLPILTSNTDPTERVPGWSDCFTDFHTSQVHTYMESVVVGQFSQVGIRRCPDLVRCSLEDFSRRGPVSGGSSRLCASWCKLQTCRHCSVSGAIDAGMFPAADYLRFRDEATGGVAVEIPGQATRVKPPRCFRSNSNMTKRCDAAPPEQLYTWESTLNLLTQRIIKIGERILNVLIDSSCLTGGVVPTEK